jgi:peptide/nickel transport system permease protein
MRGEKNRHREEDKKKESALRSVLIRLSKNQAAMTGMVILIIEVIIAIAAPVIMPYSFDEMDLTNMAASPSWDHVMGTDDLGRDIFSRILYGTRYSLGLGIGAVVFGIVFAVIIGSIAGYFGDHVDNIVMRALDIIQAIPSMILMIVISTVLGPGFFNTIIAMSIGGIAGGARTLRASILKVRKMEYLEASEAINCSKLRIIWKHVLPNAFSPLIVQSTMNVGGTILQAAGLSFIGLGVQPPTPEWGALLSGGRNYIRYSPHMVMFPGIAIMITVLALNMMGDGLRDALDPKLKD